MEKKFKQVVIGLSGGVDSSLVAGIAVDALGPDRVQGVSMPSRYSSQGSEDDAVALAANLGIALHRIPIEAAHSALTDMLDPLFDGQEPDLTEENLQSRIRGVLLMALSNKNGWLVLTTGNKSETSVGYSTLYGDTAGGFAVIKDCPSCSSMNFVRGETRRLLRLGFPKRQSLNLPQLNFDRTRLMISRYLPTGVDPLLEAYVELDWTAAELVAEGHDLNWLIESPAWWIWPSTNAVSPHRPSYLR